MRPSARPNAICHRNGSVLSARTSPRPSHSGQYRGLQEAIERDTFGIVLVFEYHRRAC